MGMADTAEGRWAAQNHQCRSICRLTMELFVTPVSPMHQQYVCVASSQLDAGGLPSSAAPPHTRDGRRTGLVFDTAMDWIELANLLGSTALCRLSSIQARAVAHKSVPGPRSHDEHTTPPAA
jgi:hypothetical protein